MADKKDDKEEAATAAAVAAPATTASDKPAEPAKPAIPSDKMIEEDDEFEEFETQDWTEKDMVKADPALWNDDWANEDPDDDFCKHLRAQLEKTKAVKTGKQWPSDFSEWMMCSYFDDVAREIHFEDINNCLCMYSGMNV